MAKQEILNMFSDINFAYNDSSKYETLSELIDELLKEQEVKRTKETKGSSLRSVKFIPGKRAGIKEDPLKEGIIEVRPGTKGIDLGKKKYTMAYIRVLDDQHCFKGMCLYSDKLPDDYDVICYYRDPSHGLTVLRPVTQEMNLGKDIMTVVQSDHDGGILYDPFQSYCVAVLEHLIK